MATIYVNEGVLYSAQAFRDGFNFSRALRLFQNSVAIAVGTVNADLNEANFSGYVNVDPGAPALTWDAGNERAVLTYPAVNFVHNGGGVSNVIYGWYFSGAFNYDGNNKILTAGNFSPSYNMVNNGDTITVQAVIHFARP